MLIFAGYTFRSTFDSIPERVGLTDNIEFLRVYLKLKQVDTPTKSKNAQREIVKIIDLIYFPAFFSSYISRRKLSSDINLRFILRVCLPHNCSGNNCFILAAKTFPTSHCSPHYGVRKNEPCKITGVILNNGLENALKLNFVFHHFVLFL